MSGSEKNSRGVSAADARRDKVRVRRMYLRYPGPEEIRQTRGRNTVLIETTRMSKTIAMLKAAEYSPTAWGSFRAPSRIRPIQ